ncbi:MAG TPA: hypothetical protein ENK93_00230 [Campylobacteraceae bacterium]|jgi:hypothetical protein|nr:hypothetical protein [Campylobacteraceae bacterium]
MDNVTTIDSMLVKHLAQIEEDILRLSQMLATQPLQRREEIDSLLSEIASLAIRSRTRVVKIETVERASVSTQKHADERDAVVTPKEIRELLETFA